MTTYTYSTTITVTVHMAGDGETFDDEVQHWDSPEAQEESAREWAMQALPLETYAESFVEVDAPPLTLDARHSEPTREHDSE